MLGDLGELEEIMPIELRCGGTMHGKLSLENHTIEVKCKRRSCGARPGVVVLHTFNLSTGSLVDTKKFADPQRASHRK